MKYQNHKAFVKGIIGGEWGSVGLKSRNPICCGVGPGRQKYDDNDIIASKVDTNSKCKFFGI